METKRLEGLWFDDLELETRIESPRRTVTEADIVAFAGLSGDFNPLHTDETTASRTAFRGRIAHGLLVQSIGSGLVNQTGAFHNTIAALAEMSIRYLAPVRAGDTIGVVLTVRDKDPAPSVKRGWVLFDCVVTNQDGVQVIEGEWRTLHLRQRARR
jgi:3-hydroxybutyryl-CoA dehydratase